MGGRRTGDTSLGDLIAAAYEWSLDEAAIQRFLAGVTQSVGGNTGNLVFYAPERGVGLLAASYNVQEEARRLYGQHYWSLDVWRIAGERAPVGRALIGHALVPPERFLKSEIYNDFFRRYEDIMYFCGGKIFAHGASGAAISVVRTRRQGSFGAAGIATMNALLPHVRRAFDLRLRFAPLAGRGEAALDLLDRRSAGVMVIANGRIQHATPGAKHWIDSGEALYVTDGRLRARVSRLDAKLAAAIDGAGARRLPTVIDVPDRRGAPALRLTILPTEVPTPLDALRGSHVLVVIDDLAHAHPSGVDGVAASYGLTPAEAQLLGLLAEGKTVREASELRQVSVHTTRNQLKQILHKTRCRRQSELVRLCLPGSTPAPRRAPTT